MPHYCPPRNRNPYPRKVSRRSDGEGKSRGDGNSRGEGSRGSTSDCEDDDDDCDDYCDDRFSKTKSKPHAFPFPFQNEEKESYYRAKDVEYKKKEEEFKRRERDFEFNPPSDDTFSCMSEAEHIETSDDDTAGHDNISEYEEKCDASTVPTDNSRRHTETYILRIPKNISNSKEPPSTIIKIHVIEGKLAWKYGVAGVGGILPSSHPYYSVSPT